MRLRQPLRRASVHGSVAVERHADVVRDELRVKEVEAVAEPRVTFSYKPNLRVLGPRLGGELATVRAALAAGDFEELGAGRVRVAGHELGGDELLVERAKERGWAHSERLSVGLDLELDDDLLAEGRVLDLIHALNSLRKERGLELTDRIAVTLPAGDADLLTQHADWIKQETLAERIDANGAALEIAKV